LTAESLACDKTGVRDSLADSKAGVAFSIIGAAFSFAIS